MATKTPAAKIPASKMAAWRLFLTAHARITAQLEAELQDADEIPLAWYDVLVQLTEAGGRLRMQDLAQAVLLSKSGLTRLVDRMEAERLVRREECVTDRRGTVAAITPRGTSALRHAAPVHVAGIERHFASVLTGAEAAAMQGGFKRMLTALGEGGASD
jgi:DNA-binding MarR family transcriptional regulator